jgi:tRNA nucleotidyltransferase (CCA-adding enzyme)
MRPDAPRAVGEIVRILEDAGHATWAVGGAVRDALLGHPTGDWDFATAARPKQVRRLFRRTVPIGIEHGTVGVFGSDGVLYEVTTFRRDVETTGRHAVVEFADRIEEDLARRDFTFNAVAWHPLREELLDPHDGVRDLERRVLRTVGEPAERFAEDYLRVLRALRFAGHFELEPEASTWEALKAVTARLKLLSAERVREELVKVLGRTRHASRSLELYHTSGSFGVLVPEIEAVAALADDAHPHPWARTLAAIDVLPPRRWLLRLATLLHAVGMPRARSRDLRGGWRYVGHEALGARSADDVLRRLRFSNAERERVVRLVARQSDLFPPDAPPQGVRRWLRDVGPDLVPDLFRLRFALHAGVTPGQRLAPDLHERWCSARRVLRERPPLSVAELAIGGGELRELGFAPGPIYAQILGALLERVLEDPSLNTKDTLTEIVRREVPT